MAGMSKPTPGTASSCLPWCGHRGSGAGGLVCALASLGGVARGISSPLGKELGVGVLEAGRLRALNLGHQEDSLLSGSTFGPLSAGSALARSTLRALPGP